MESHTQNQTNVRLLVSVPRPASFMENKVEIVNTDKFRKPGLTPELRFDKVIINGDITGAFRELKANLKQIEEAQVQWIPAEWIRSSPTKARRSCGQLTGWI